MISRARRASHLIAMKSPAVTSEASSSALAAEVELSSKIKACLLNNCPDARQEAMLAVAWGEPAVLQQKLQDSSQALRDGVGSTDGDSEASADVLQVALMHGDVRIVRTALDCGAEPCNVCLSELFVERFNRYSTRRRGIRNRRQPEQHRTARRRTPDALCVYLVRRGARDAGAVVASSEEAGQSEG